MIDDTRIVYSHDGTPRSVTVDGIEYPIDELRYLIWRGVNLKRLLALAMLYGIVIGGVLALAFLR